LLKEAGYPNGFEAGECSTDTAFSSLVEAAVNDLGAVGIRAKVRPMERAAVQAAQTEKTVKNLTRQGSGAFGNAASRIEAFMHSKGTLSFLKDPEIDAWFAQQATEHDPKKREAWLHQIQQKVYDEARFLPIWELTVLHASGPRVAVSGLGMIPLFAYSGPYKDVQLKS
jgi:peptide/nickel transport system substrate-binding protein